MLASFESFHKPLPTLAGHDRAVLFDSLPRAVQRSMWIRLREQRDDTRFLDGLVEWRSMRPAKVYKMPQMIQRPEVVEDHLVRIDAADYLESFGVDVFPGGRNRCPFPEHEDRNPSASHRGGVWRCHRCGVGGGIYQAASAVSGIGTRGSEFIELRRWIAERLIGQVAA